MKNCIVRLNRAPDRAGGLRRKSPDELLIQHEKHLQQMQEVRGKLAPVFTELNIQTAQINEMPGMGTIVISDITDEQRQRLEEVVQAENIGSLSDDLRITPIADPSSTEHPSPTSKF